MLLRKVTGLSSNPHYPVRGTPASIVIAPCRWLANRHPLNERRSQLYAIVPDLVRASGLDRMVFTLPCRYSVVVGTITMIRETQRTEELVKQYAVLVRPRRGDLEYIVVRCKAGQTQFDLEEDHNAHFETSFAAYDEAEAYRRKCDCLTEELVLGG